MDGPWRRHPADLARLVLGVALAVVAGTIGALQPAVVRQVSGDITALFDHVPNGVVAVAVGLLQIGAAALPVAALVVAAKVWPPKYVLLTVVGAVVAGTAVLVLSDALSDVIPTAARSNADRPSWLTSRRFPSGPYLGALMGAVTIGAPVLTRSWRRTAYWTVVGVAFTRVITSLEAPLNLTITLAAGAACGSAVLVAVGAPSRRPTPERVAAALANGGLVLDDVVAVEGSDDRFRASSTDGMGIDIRTVGRDQRDSALLARLIRWIRVRGIDDGTSLTAERAAEREALHGLLASAVDAPVVPVLALGTDDTERLAAIAFGRIDGSRLDDVDDVSDATLDAAFRSASKMWSARIAHRQLGPRHLILRDEDVMIAHLDRSVRNADDPTLLSDLACLLVTTAGLTSPSRCVDAAVRVLGDRVGEVLPYLQQLALSEECQGIVQRDPTLLGALASAIRERTGAPEVELAPIERLSAARVVAAIGALVLMSFLFSLLSDASAIWASLGAARTDVFPGLILLAAVPFLASALTLQGSVTTRLPFARTAEAMLAQGFLNRITPANSGGMALRARYLQRHGVPLDIAAVSIGLTSLAAGIAQTVLAAVFVAWAGGGEGPGFDLPSGSVAVAVIATLLGAVGAVAATAWGRRLLRRVRVTVGRITDELVGLARRPTRVALLLGGSILGKLATIGAFVLAVEALRSDLGVAQVCTTYLVATSVASAAPTPGGVGAVEGALAAALTGLGVDTAAAVSSVVLFRLATFWLPVIPGAMALRHLQRRDAV